MSPVRIIPTLFVAALGLILLASCTRTSSSTPVAISSDFALKPGTFKVGGTRRAADLGTLRAPENRILGTPGASPSADKAGSRWIEIPFVRIRADKPQSACPVFILNGIPDSNLQFSDDFLLENHDVVLVGYRGRDGSSTLKTPEVEKALRAEHGDLFERQAIEKLRLALHRDYLDLVSQGCDLNGYNAREVVEDLESVRRILGYEHIDILSGSWGTRLAYLYSLQYPEHVERSIMLGANPPGGCVYDPLVSESILRQYAARWDAQPECAAKTPDILASIKRVLATLPAHREGFDLHPGQVRAGLFMSLSSTEMAAQAFDAFAAAEHGDYRGIAFLSVFSDVTLKNGVMMKWFWGDGACKAGSIDSPPPGDVIADAIPDGCTMGAPMTQLLWGMSAEGAWPVTLLPEGYRTLRPCAVPTLIVQGELDVLTPAVRARQYEPFLKNGQFIVLPATGHVGDVKWHQRTAFEHLVKVYLDQGRVDQSLYQTAQLNLIPKNSYQSQFSKMKWPLKALFLWKSLF